MLEIVDWFWSSVAPKEAFGSKPYEMACAYSSKKQWKSNRTKMRELSLRQDEVLSIRFSE